MKKKQLKLLSVDDNTINLMLVKKMLLTFPYIDTVINAHNGIEAIKLLKSHNDFDAIILDIEMPLMDGIEMLKTLNVDDIDIPPVIIATANDERKGVALNSGANAFLVKPLRKQTLSDTLKSLVDIN